MALGGWKRRNERAWRDESENAGTVGVDDEKRLEGCQGPRRDEISAASAGQRGYCKGKGRGTGGDSLIRGMGGGVFQMGVAKGWSWEVGGWLGAVEAEGLIVWCKGEKKKSLLTSEEGKKRRAKRCRLCSRGNMAAAQAAIPLPCVIEPDQTILGDNSPIKS